MPLGKAEHLFKPITDEEIAAEVDRLRATGPVDQVSVAASIKEKLVSNVKPLVFEAPIVEPKPVITFDDFTKLDLRIGTIATAERVPKADKLLRLTIEVGEASPRTVVSGIAEHFNPEELPGKQVLLLCNLEPRKMRGVESQGMVLMAEDAMGKLAFVQPDRELPNGVEVR